MNQAITAKDFTIESPIGLLVVGPELKQAFEGFLVEANNYLTGTKDQETIDKMIVLAYKCTGHIYWGTRSEMLYDNGYPEMVLLINFLGKFYPAAKE